MSQFASRAAEQSEAVAAGGRVGDGSYGRRAETPARTARRCLAVLRTREVRLPGAIPDPPACCILIDLLDASDLRRVGAPATPKKTARGTPRFRPFGAHEPMASCGRRRHRGIAVPMPSRVVTTNLRFPERLWREVRLQALRRRMTAAGLVREAVETYLGRKGSAPDSAEDAFDRHVGAIAGSAGDESSRTTITISMVGPRRTRVKLLADSSALLALVLRRDQNHLAAKGFVENTPAPGSS